MKDKKKRFSYDSTSFINHLYKKSSKRNKNNHFIKLESGYDVFLPENVYCSLVSTTLSVVNKTLSLSKCGFVMGLIGGCTKGKNTFVTEMRTFIVSGPENNYEGGSSDNSSNTFKFKDEDYEKLYIWNEELYKKKNFIVGWFKGLNSEYTPHGVDFKTLHSYHIQNPLAFMIICNPLKLSVLDPGILLIRLADIEETDGSGEYPFEYLSFKIELRSEFQEKPFNLIFQEKFPKYFGKKFEINEFITLKLEYGKTNIYVKSQLFNQCKFLLLNIPIEKVIFLKKKSM